jgi:hypothetical protein
MSTKKKLVLGGIVVLGVGGVAAYALTSGAAPPPVTSGPPVDPRLAKQQECAALTQQLSDMRNQPTPDRATMQRLETNIATCNAQLVELGAPVDTAAATLSTGDALYTRIENWFTEYKGTDSGGDPARRNTIRQEMLNAGASMAAAYDEAITQASTAPALKLVAQSIVRALNASLGRVICFMLSERGCGTWGAGEDQPDAKAGAEQARVVVPLLAVYAKVVTKAGGPTRALAAADGEAFLTAILRPCAALQTYIDGEWAHYKNIQWSESLMRNNTRNSIRSAGREQVTCLQNVFTSASSFGSLTALRAVSAVAMTALRASIARWNCFFNNGAGCGTFASNEDQPDVKAQQEMADIGAPLMTLYARIAAALVARGTVTAFEPLVTAKLSVCKAIKDWIDVQSAHLTSTSYIDPLKRNNTRSSMLQAGAALATCLQDTLDVAVSATKPASPAARGVSGLLGMGGFGGYVQDGLGQPLLTIPVTTVSSTPTLQASVATRAATAPAPVPPKVDVTRMIRPIATLTASAIDAAITRKICYLYSQPGCGSMGSEASGPDKADEEQRWVITPLVAVYKKTVVADKANADAETPLVRALMREITTAKDYIEGEERHLTSTGYPDWVTRNNTRGSIISAGRRMVAALQNAKPTTAAGKAPLRAVAQAALASSTRRGLCYANRQPGCDRNGEWEPEGMAKYNEEKAAIGDPLTALLANRTTGLGSLGDEPAGLPTIAWVGLAAVGGAIVYSMLQKPVRKNKRRSRRSSRRTSRRAA